MSNYDCKDSALDEHLPPRDDELAPAFERDWTPDEESRAKTK